MNYNSEFVNELLGNFYASFMESESHWCDISHLDPEGDNYKFKSYQMLYTLRYFPAYYLEYCILAEALQKRLEKNYTKVKIASFGCGICTDYFALRDNLTKVPFEYAGYDHWAWSRQSLIPGEKGSNFSFNLFDTDNFKLGDLTDIDVFFFPKSIGDIDAGGGLEHLAKIIASTDKNRIFFLNSYISNGTRVMSGNARCFNRIHEALAAEGFKTEDNVGSTSWRGEFGDGLRKICWDFCYPEEYLVMCEDQGSFSECDGCGVVKKPVMTNRFMEYQILEYSR